MKTWSRRAVVMTAVLSSMLGLSGLAAPAAQADSNWGCPYPYVCVYQGNYWDGNITAMFKDVTSYYQNTTPRSPWSVVNTRNDDTVWIRTDTGGGFCLPPNTVGGGGNTITGIRISSSATC